jgi:hypothetical protein
MSIVLWYQEPRVVPFNPKPGGCTTAGSKMTAYFMLAEPSAIEESSREFSRNKRPAPKDWAESYLVAFANVAGLRVVTFDQAPALKGRRHPLVNLADEEDGARGFPTAQNE